MSLDPVKIGFIPLVDAAIPIIAADVGFAAEEGIALELVREVSWANIRDRLTLGHFDGAHLLAPIAIATTLGLGTIKVPLAAPLALGLNGNAMTMSPPLFEDIRRHMAPGADMADPRATGAAFRAVVENRRRNGDEPPTLGMTFPFSTHNYQLRLWLAAAGVEPDEDVRLAVVPPPFMVDALENAHVEGFCVGAPWNSVAVEYNLGRILHLGTDLVRRCPEKVLAVRANWLARNPELAARLVRACVRAAEWLDEPNHREEAARRLAAPNRLDVHAPIIQRALDGRLPTGDGDEIRACDSYVLFGADGATRPDPRHARWLHAQMVRWRQASDDPAGADLAAASYRTDVYDAALGRDAPQQADDPLGVFTD
ncbi:NitT/TauT family transport system ATP-binding protein [Methylopila capsulata]|uniref:NitT/TauT family transport system ATP-binding protein n=1 Tax=Methylopila capsulata TaxID=61654 RepID=A0A9W6IYJ7_9HYPH|nr:CmpA/NrtA family ABC transporter substrate-binding protein [Methylopila capsulata]MBM7853121.1 NitT/TauT family transport system ATP-binding protein [Methylopila capsulata]GLK57665.1 nitrate transporter [Methylopila capsulata]